VDLALLEMAANGTALDAGQAALVRQMCTSGARVQLAIAPAGAGKTTAMRTLTLSWTQDGGQVLGLAPSAAAAAVLAEQTGIHADTLAKLTWSLRHGNLPEWAASVGPSTLLIIDEAGMADTLSLDAAVQFALERGASVRLIGDDQQLAAIGAGGVLRDITHTHGALRLTELHRFTDPAEAAASLALRDGQSRSLDFYLDHGRIHVGDLATTTADAFNAWISDRAAGLDTILIAPHPRPGRRTQPPRPRPSSQRRPSSLRGAVSRRKPGQRRRCGHHPQQRPPTPPHGHRLGQERRPLDYHPRRPTR
jgi:AAA domain